MGRKVIIIAGILGCLINLFSCFYGQCEALSMRVSDGSAAELIRFAAREGNINVIMDSSADSHVSVNFQDVTPREAIDRIVVAGGLDISEQEGTLIIGRGRDIVSSMGQVHVIPVAYGDLEELKRDVELYFQNKNVGDMRKANKSSTKNKASENPGKSENKEKNGGLGIEENIIKGDNKGRSDTYSSVGNSNKASRVAVDINTRSLLVYGTAEEARDVRRLLGQLDVPAQQVSLEARVVAVKREDLEKLGVTWEWTKLFHDFSYDAALDLLISQGKARVLSRPNIVTMQGQEAVINIGGEVPVPEVSITNTATTTSIRYRPAGIILQCRPFVNDDGYIDSQLNIEVSAPSYVKEMNAYSFHKRSARTRVRLKDGETLIIGGLISREEVKQLQKIPFLGDIPILGNFFKATSTKTTEEEITIFIKANILR
ncbi:type II and III secretion system protein [Anaerovibrio sp. JC8]|uniref:type II secretion system protein GspD n=1 Tax=Anaerovibrio sp. JC8 TaxID=1240085 RepID=UPI000A0A8EFE|nr:secretin N-terminal domain-containing protein [Anaerovibrio sp. JC8]ORU01036.1 type II and III secretion system protein [Anaerovibrio sp. JC8]